MAKNSNYLKRIKTIIHCGWAVRDLILGKKQDFDLLDAKPDEV